MSIITKRGDLGHTDLLFNKKSRKDSPRVEALGAVDELNASLGLVRVHASEQVLIDWVEGVQKTLINLMGEVATEPVDHAKYKAKGYGTVEVEDVLALEDLAKSYEDTGNTFRGWVKPGEDSSILTAHLHMARTVCRRAERRCWALPMESRTTCLYLNRLADVLWLMGNDA